jgi:hypothetical protein
MAKKTKKSQDKITKAGAVELDENALDDVKGGLTTLSSPIYKFGGTIDGNLESTSLKNLNKFNTDFKI